MFVQKSSEFQLYYNIFIDKLIRNTVTYVVLNDVAVLQRTAAITSEVINSNDVVQPPNSLCHLDLAGGGGQGGQAWSSISLPCYHVVALQIRPTYEHNQKCQPKGATVASRPFEFKIK